MPDSEGEREQREKAEALLEEEERSLEEWTRQCLDYYDIYLDNIGE